MDRESESERSREPKSLRWLLASLSLACTLSARAATNQTTVASTNSAPIPANLQEGKRIYDQHCAACHGRNGRGDGPAAVWLYPKPRHFDSGLFKIKSTPPGSLPTDEDLFHTVTRGMPG